MVLSGVGKKLSKKRITCDLAISDPGSDDSWAALYKGQSQVESITKSLPNKGPTQISPSKVPPPAPSVNAVSYPTSKAKEAIGDKRRRSELENSDVTKNKKPQAFTSTPFVKHKKVPSFEVSSIISPIDITSDGHSEKSLADSTSLVVNRKNPTKPPDETFNQLLNPGKNVPKQTSLPFGVQPLKSVINQADTTRQYAGGIVRGGKKNKFENDHAESSWETAEEVTLTSESKKTAGSASKDSQKSQRTSKTLEKSAENDEGSGIPDDPNPLNNADAHDRDRSRQAVSIVKSSQDSSGLGVRTDNLLSHSSPNVSGHIAADMCAPIVGDGVILVDDGKIACERETGSKSTSRSSKVATELLGPLSEEPKLSSLKENKISDTERCINKGTGVQITNNSESNKSFRKREEHEGDSCSREKPEGRTIMPQTHGNKSDLNIVSRQITEAESLQKGDTNVLFAEKPLLACYQQFDFAVQIGSMCVKQTSCIGFSLNSQQTKAGKNENLNLSKNHSKEGHRLEKSDNIHQGVCPVQNTSELENQEDILAITSQQKSAFVGTSTMQKNSQDVSSTASKSATNQPMTTNDIILESSSEEERILLRAQSLRLRENQSNACRISKISKNHDIGPLGISAQRSRLKSLSFAGTSDIQQKSPAKSLQEKPLETGMKIQQSVPLSSVDTDNFQISKPEAVEHSAVGENTRSSCEDLVFISRNPPDFNNSFENNNFEHDNFELVIMSSSEEEKPKKSQKQVSKTNAVADYVHLQKNNVCKNSKQLLRGRNVSLKIKEVRRRRERKINELLRSKRESSSSDDESVHPSDLVNTDLNDKQHIKEVNGVKQSRKLRKKCGGKIREGNGRRSSECLEEGQAHNSESKARQVIDFSLSGALKATPNVEVEVEEAIGEQDFLPSSHGEPDSNEEGQKELNPQAPEGQKELHPQAPEDNWSLRNQPTKTALEKAEEKPPVQSRKASCPSTAVNKNKELNKIAAQDHNIRDRNVVKISEEDASGLRCSRRKRHAPAMYWLGQRTRYKVLENGCQEAMDESLGTSRTQPASHKIQLHSIPAKSMKRKVEKGSKPETKMSKRSKQPKVNLQPSANEYRVFEALSQSDGQNLTCDLEEVKERMCVSGCGVKGDIVALGVGASFDKQMPSHFNQVYYVLEGEVSCKFTDEERTLVAGSFFIVPRAEVCHIKNKWNSTVKLVVVSCTA